MDYVQVTREQREEMLKTVGASTMDDLLRQVPDGIRLKRGLNIPAGLDEMSLRVELAGMAGRNRSVEQKVCFLGAGVYDHFIPTVVDALAMKGEFVTAYTPYQAEASQGSLQAFFEFQTMVCRLTGMDVSNASLYEGATAAAEGAMMALNVTGKREVWVSAGVHPHYREVLKTYLADLPAKYVEVPLKDGVTELPEVGADVAAVVVQSPNFLGLIERVTDMSKAAHDKGSLCVQVFNPVSLGILKRPGEMDVDIAAGEGQPLGIPLQFGGPYLGLFACKNQYMRKMPGRLVGQTVDTEGKRAFCLTLQTREQHIRREKATSNVCTNQGLLALRASVYMAAMGGAGIRDVAQLSYNKACYLKSELERCGIRVRFDKAHFNELLVRVKGRVADVIRRGDDAGMLVGHEVGRHYPEFGDCLLVAVTEKRTKGEIDRLVGVIAG